MLDYHKTPKGVKSVMLVLGLESSCDETSVALVTEQKKILVNLVLSQIKEHQAFGGVVPEIAARSHLMHMDQLIQTALKDADVSLKDIDGIAATGGPGLIGGLLIGTMMAKTMAFVHQKPYLAINHLQAHALTARLTHDVSFPYLLLLVSGGHCQLLQVKNVNSYQLLGTTIDDAVGEAFDKVSKMLDIGYPGGPAVEKTALKGDASAFDFPRPLKGQNNCNFSFSGLKTAVLRTFEASEKSDQVKADICASFQEAVIDTIEDRIIHALKKVKTKTLVMAGGVSANKHLRQRLEEMSQSHQIDFVAPPISLCGDNAAMVAWAGIENLKQNKTSAFDFKPRPRWPLEELNA